MPIQKKYNKDFFKTWSHEMAYILGFLYADGNIVKTKRNTHFVAIYTADKSLLEDMKAIFSAEHKISQRVSKTGVVYRLQIGSKEWFNDLGMVDLTPSKARRMNLPRVPTSFFGDFIRGYFDGDGNVWVGYAHKKRINPTLTIAAAFTSASLSFLKALLKELSSRGIQGGSIYVHPVRGYARLQFAINDALKLYEIMYTSPGKLFLKRKKDVFEQFIKTRSRSSTG